MYYNLLRKNNKENSLFFASLIVSIIAFYIILSLENQAVIRFLRTMEGDALNRLLQLIPVLYGITLVILFFLIYFAERYQMEKQCHEFGIYRMLGMKQHQLLWISAINELKNSILSLAIGIPIAVFISEIISLITAKAVGLGLIGHTFSVSIKALKWTIAGYLFIRFAVQAILCQKMMKKEITELLSQPKQYQNILFQKGRAVIQILAGFLFLASAYALAITGISWASVYHIGFTAVLGLIGTFLLFCGMGILFEIILKKSGCNNGLSIFTFRQLQEMVFHRPISLAIASLLLLIALCCFGYGISIYIYFNSSQDHVIDYSFQGEESEIRKITDDINGFKQIFEIRTGATGIAGGDHFSAEPLLDLLKKQTDSNGKKVLLNHLKALQNPYLISLSGYNQLLKASGKESIQLNDNQAVLYNDPDNSYGNSAYLLKKVLSENTSVQIGQNTFQLDNRLFQDNIVVDRMIAIGYGFIVSDTVFEQLTGGEYSSYWNAILNKELTNKNGLMQTIMKTNDLLNQTGIRYESYLQNMGRQLFYNVAGSYTTIYLAVIFIVIANTIIGVQFLIHQQNAGKRYHIIKHLGCLNSQLKQSAHRQIIWYFSLPIAVAVFSSIFGVRSLMTGLISSSMKENRFQLMIYAMAVLLVICVIECIYIVSVIKISDKRIQMFMKIKRND